MLYYNILNCRGGVYVRECLICRTCTEDGRIVFLTYNASDGKVCGYSNEDITRKIVERKIVNAKLENTVVKITDSRNILPKLSFEENKSSRVFYIADVYMSASGSRIYLAVSNTGERFEFSENLAADFCRGRQVINGYMTKNGLRLINVTAFTTALSKPLEHAETD